jgi:DNA-binding NarL/FixJ family response regulator
LNTIKGLGVIKVVLVDDHEMVRQGVKKLLSRDVRIQVVGEAVSSNEAISLISRLQPDVALTDIRLKSGSGIDVSKAARNVAPNTKVLVLSAYDDERYVSSVMRLGASGYLLKTASGKELTKAIHDAVKGQLVFSPLISNKVKNLFQGIKNEKHVADELNSNINLTSREAQVLENISLGLRNSDIARSMGISSKTVEVHIEHILI